MPTREVLLCSNLNALKENLSLSAKCDPISFNRLEMHEAVSIINHPMTRGHTNQQILFLYEGGRATLLSPTEKN